MKDRDTGMLSHLRTLGLQFFANKGIKKQSSRELRKSIQSWRDRAEEHRDKLNNPEQYDRGWHEKTDIQREGLLGHWRKEIRHYEENILEANEELKRRGEDE